MDGMGMMLGAMLPKILDSMGVDKDFVTQQVTNASDTVKSFDQRFRSLERVVSSIGTAILRQNEENRLAHAMLTDVWEVVTKTGGVIAPAGEGMACAEGSGDNFVAHHTASFVESSTALTITEVVT